MIYTFYSFKGGVGRSMALANIAELLYNRGLKVLMIDFDLEAPGLEQYFKVSAARVSPSEIVGRRGVIDMLHSYREMRTYSPLRSPILPDTHPAESSPAIPFHKQQLAKATHNPAFYHSVEPVRNFMIDIYDRNDRGGTLSLMPAGNRVDSSYSDYAKRVLGFSWSEFYLTLDGEDFFDWFRSELEREFEVILIDSRTGVTEMGGVCTHQLADVVVTFVATNHQNLDGVRMMARSLTNPDLVNKARHGRLLQLLFVPARVEERAEEDQFDAFAKLFDDHLRPLFPKQAVFKDGPFHDLKLFYVPAYSYMERVAVREPDRASKIDLIKAYERLASTMAMLAPPDQALYLTYSQAPEVRLAKIAEELFLSSSFEEQQALKEVFTRLIRPEPKALTPKSATFYEISPLGRGAIGTLSRALLTLSSSGQIDLADPKLVHAWSRLAEWIIEDHEYLTWREWVASVIQLWKASRSGEQLLLFGPPLEEAQQWLSLKRDSFNETEIEFVNASLAARWGRFTEETFVSAEPPVQEAIKDVFTRVVRFNDDGYTAVPAPIHEISKKGQSAIPLLAASGVIRSVSVAGDASDLFLYRMQQVEPTEPEMVQSWSRLRDWLVKDEAYLRWRNRIHPVVSLFEAGNLDEEKLLSGQDLAEAQQWMERCPESLNEAEIRFVSRSFQLQETRKTEALKRETARKHRSRIRFVVVIVAITILTLAVAAGAVGVSSFYRSLRG